MKLYLVAAKPITSKKGEDYIVLAVMDSKGEVNTLFVEDKSENRYILDMVPSVDALTSELQSLDMEFDMRGRVVKISQ